MQVKSIATSQNVVASITSVDDVVAVAVSSAEFIGTSGAKDPVVAVATENRIVSIGTNEAIVPVIAMDRVVAGTANQVIDSTTAAECVVASVTVSGDLCRCVVGEGIVAAKS